MTSAPGDSLPPNAVAVIGMAGRFPGADSVSQFWRNLRAGAEAIVTLSEDELVAAGVGEKALASHSYIRRGALMDGVEEFDAEFFGLTPHSARMMDPQHRLFLQTAWHALEDAGHEPGRGEGSVGVFGTSSTSGYLLHNLMSHIDPHAIIGEGATFEMVSLSLQNDKDHLATRAAHQFNLRGPALSVQTACSSSLVAVHLACQAVLNGECDIALAGGSSVRIPHRVGYWHEPGSMVSPSGHCRPFDVRADGTIFGSGVGVVVLKPLQDAIDDGDRIHAVIRGSAVNNDGSTKMNYAAPNAAGQAEAIAEAHAVADVDASTISFVETHGTGTPLGDPVEIEGLRQAFELAEEDRPGPCVLGSVKSNIGHLEVASGIASLIKTILCLENKAIPGTLHYTSPNPELHLERSPFEIRADYSPWEWPGPRRAGVSSFGVGGTNVHVVLEEAPPVAPADVVGGPQIVTLSARSAEALTQARVALAEELTAADEVALADVAFTLADRRTEVCRLAAVVAEPRNAAAMLRAAEHDNVFVGEAPAAANDPDRVAFVFPGQGAQHVGMARGLYDSEPVFARHFDECVAAFDGELGIDLRSEIFEGTARNLERTDRAQPALFTVEYALAKLIESRGVRPAALAGHSIGEYAAATFAGVFDLETAVKAVSVRARLMHASPRGVMVAVARSADEIAEHLTADVDLATVNDPGSCVVAGTEDAIAAFQDGLAQHGIVARRVRTSHAFHSRLMDGVIAEFSSQLSRLSLGKPRIPLLSNVTGTWMSDAEAVNPATWARQIRSTVRFSDELDVLLGLPSRVLVEVGPGGTLTASAVRHPRWSSDHRAVRLMRHQTQNRDDHSTFLLALGQLWAADVDVALGSNAAPGRRMSLPGYPFERQRHWVEYNSATRLHDGAGATTGAVPPVQAQSAAAASGTSPMEVTLHRIWTQCLGVASIDRNADFFDVGGDSLVAISVAMTASHEGLDLTPQDLYDNKTIAALAKTLVARYADGGLARPTPGEVTHPPVPPNIAHFLEHGLRDAERWRIPLLLKLRHDITSADVDAVLTAVVNHHEALRTHLVARAGTWEQHTAEAISSAPVATAALPVGVESGSAAERDALLAILDSRITGETGGEPLVATHITAGAGLPSFLGVSLHGTVGDTTSRDVLLVDIFTAFAQRLAGEPIVLQPTTTSWNEWARRCAALGAHPAVVDSRDYWLDAAARPTVRLSQSTTMDPPSSEDMVRVPAALTVSETGEVDEARRVLRLPLDHLLLAALAATIAGTVGDGEVAVDVGGPGRSVLKPDVDFGRTVGWFTTLYPLVLNCSVGEEATAAERIDGVRDAAKVVPHYGIGHGLLRYVYAPTARRMAAHAPADILFTHAGAIPELPDLGADAPVQFDTDTALPIREAVSGLGHAVELRAYRSGGVLHTDWWYDARRIQSAQAESLAREFTARLMDLTRQCGDDSDSDSADDDLTLVDLS